MSIHTKVKAVKTSNGEWGIETAPGSYCAICYGHNMGKETAERIAACINAQLDKKTEEIE